MNNKVYINPKFNKTSNTDSTLTSNNKMHVNPKFSQQMMQNNGRIYVNPHFVKSNVNCPLAQNEISYDRDDTSMRKGLSFVPTKVSENISQNITSVSRYSIVRSTATQDLPNQPYVKPTTIKLNKYKSVAIGTFKKKFEIKLSSKDSDKSASAKGQLLFLRSDKKDSPQKHKQTLQYLGGQNCIKNNVRSRFMVRNTPFVSNKYVSTSSPVRSKIKSNFKKNNVPCPLFKKYGKCLRSIHSTCDFLHDKKHVSICRKFMKGICHDKGCLLSHEVTSKKMPTCYFYLKGMCVKEHCPYVHVKLNEKSKICSEFLKGYCEKGDKCLNRHVATDKDTNKNKGANNILCSLNNVKNKQKKINKYKITVTKDLTKISQSIPANIGKQDKNSQSEIRYYKEQQTTVNISESSEVIKPSRCKLGTLPSFIKL